MIYLIIAVWIACGAIALKTSPKADGWGYALHNIAMIHWIWAVVGIAVIWSLGPVFYIIDRWVLRKKNKK